MVEACTCSGEKKGLLQCGGSRKKKKKREGCMIGVKKVVRGVKYSTRRISVGCGGVTHMSDAV